MAEDNFLTGIDTSMAKGTGSSALGLTPPVAPPMRDALGTAEGITNVQRGQAELEQVMQGLAAKKKAGQIMSIAPTLDEGIAALQADPSVAGFAPDIIATLQAVSSEQTSQAGARQVQATSGLAAVMQGLLPAVNDPETFDRLVGGQLELLSPSAREAAEAAMPVLRAALFDGLDRLDPAAAGAEYQQRLGAMIVGSGFSPEGVRAVTGALAPQVVTVIGPNGEPITLEVGGPITGEAEDDLISIGPTAAEGAQLSAEGTVAAAVESDMSATSNAFPKLITTMDHIVEALSQIETGGGADIRANLGKTLQFFQQAGMEGISDKLVDDVANGNLAATQTLSGLLRTFVTSQLKDAAQGTGAGQVAAEVQAFLDMADVTMDSQTLLNFAKMAKEKMQIDFDRAQTYPEFKKLLAEGDEKALDYGPQGYYAWYNAHRFKRDNLPQATPAGQSLTTPGTEEEMRGTPAKTRSLDDIFGG